MKKNIKSLLLVTLASATLAACNSGGSTSTSANGFQNTSTSTIKSSSDKMWSFDTGTVSLVYPQRSLRNKNIVNFVMRGDSLDTIESFGSSGYLPALINAIKQADPIDLYKDFNGQTNRSIKIVDVKLNGFHGNNEASLFTNYASGDDAEYYFKKTKPKPLSAEDKITISSYTDEKGNVYSITSQMYNLYNPQSEDNNASAKALVEKIYQEATSSTKPVIFYIHCDSGHDRTGLISTMYLLNNYMTVNNSNSYINADMQRLIELGQVVWKDDKYTITNYNDGRKYQQAAYYGDNGTGFIDIFNNSFGNANGQLQWQNIVPASIKSATPPAVNEYAWTSPLCNSGYDSACLTSSNGTLSINGSNKLPIEQISNYQFYLVYTDANGLPVKSSTNENYFEYSTTDNTTYPINIELKDKPTNAIAVKLYVYPKNNSSINQDNQIKLNYVASTTL